MKQFDSAEAGDNKDTRDLSRRGLLAGSLAAVFAKTAGSQQVRTAARKPNLILYMPETLRASSIGCYGHPLARTPNMDRLASQGVRFTTCHVQNTVCGPSRCSLLTGWPVHVRGHRSLYYFLHEDEPNLFRYLKQDGMTSIGSAKTTRWRPRPSPPASPASGRAATSAEPVADERSALLLVYLRPRRRPARNTGLSGCQGSRQGVGTDRETVFCIYLPLAYAHPPFSAPKDFHNMYEPAEAPPLRPPDLPRKPNFRGHPPDATLKRT